MAISLPTASLLYNLANLALIVSLVAGVIATVVLVWMGNIKEEYSDHEIAALSKGTAEANARAAEANAKALEAHVALEKLKAPRLIPPDKADQVISALFPFAQQEWEVTTYWDLKEPMALANNLKKQVLDFARWVYLPVTSGRFFVGVQTGIDVYFHPQAKDSTKKAAEALVAVLNSLGPEFAAALKEKNAPNNPDNIITLNIGLKP